MRDLKKIKKSCSLLESVHLSLKQEMKVGANLLAIDKFIEDECKKKQCESAPIKLYSFPGFSCISVNDVACHGVPSNSEIKEEDIINVDISICHDGVYADSSRSYHFGRDERKASLIEFARKVNLEVIESTKAGSSILSMGVKAYLACLDSNFAIIDKYGGHFIGETLHVSPFIHSTISPKNAKKLEDNDKYNKILEEGDCFCFEPIFTFKKNNENVAKVYKVGEWGVYENNGFPCVHLENTYAIINGECVSLTGSL